MISTETGFHLASFPNGWLIVLLDVTVIDSCKMTHMSVVKEKAVGWLYFPLTLCRSRSPKHQILVRVVLWDLVACEMCYCSKVLKVLPAVFVRATDFCWQIQLSGMPISHCWPPECGLTTCWRSRPLCRIILLMRTAWNVGEVSGYGMACTLYGIQALHSPSWWPELFSQ